MYQVEQVQDITDNSTFSSAFLNMSSEQKKQGERNSADTNIRLLRTSGTIFASASQYARGPPFFPHHSAPLLEE